MSPDEDPVLVDVLPSLQDWAGRTHRLTEGHTLEAFTRDLVLQLAISKAIEWTGEISGRILRRWPEFARAHPDIEFAQAYAMRHRLAHGYETVELRIV